MRKVIITLCFNRPDTIRRSIERLQETQNLDGYEKYLIDVGYPLPDRKMNTVSLSTICTRYDYELLKPSHNRGVAGNWMWAGQELNLQAGDVMIGMDPDSDPVGHGWCDAIVDVLNGSNVGYCGLTRISPPGLATEVDESRIVYSKSTINGRVVRHYGTPIGWPMGGFSVKFMREVGIRQPRPHYGFIEHETIRAMQGTTWTWVILDEFKDQTSDRGDLEFREWKVAQAKAETALDFEAWLKKKGLIL